MSAVTGASEVTRCAWATRFGSRAASARAPSPAASPWSVPRPSPHHEERHEGQGDEGQASRPDEPLRVVPGSPVEQAPRPRPVLEPVPEVVAPLRAVRGQGAAGQPRRRARHELGERRVIDLEAVVAADEMEQPLGEVRRLVVGGRVGALGHEARGHEDRDQACHDDGRPERPSRAHRQRSGSRVAMPAGGGAGLLSAAGYRLDRGRRQDASRARRTTDCGTSRAREAEPGPEADQPERRSPRGDPPRSAPRRRPGRAPEATG